MEYKDYYKTLGVPRDATKEVIKQAYRKLARKYHPDVSKEPDAEARFKEINEANEVLKDPEKRAAYDALGSQWRAGQEFRPPPGQGGFHREFHFSSGDASGFSDFFSSLFGGGLGGFGDAFAETRRGTGGRREDLFRQRGQVAEAPDNIGRIVGLILTHPQCAVSQSFSDVFRHFIASVDFRSHPLAIGLDTFGPATAMG